jgi:hypothetical protein
MESNEFKSSVIHNDLCNHKEETIRSNPIDIFRMKESLSHKRDPNKVSLEFGLR